MISVPKEVAHASLEANAWEHVSCAEVIIDRAKPGVIEHRLPEPVQSLATSEPTGWDHHRQESGLERFGLLYEQLVYRCRACAVPSIVQLIRRVPDDHIELHVSSEQLGHPSADVVRV